MTLRNVPLRRLPEKLLKPQRRLRRKLKRKLKKLLSKRHLLFLLVVHLAVVVETMVVEILLVVVHHLVEALAVEMVLGVVGLYIRLTHTRKPA